MKHDKYWREPKKVRVKGGDAESWYYADERGIEIHVQPTDGSAHITLRMTRPQLALYIKRCAR